MDLDTELDLREVAKLLGVTVEKLIRWGANGKLTITVTADDWRIRTETGAVGSISGSVDLLSQDLQLSYNADSTQVCKVSTRGDGEVLTLVEPLELRRGKLFVAPEELRRFRNKYGGLVGPIEGARPYLDSGHEWYSSQLAIAVQAWMALFSGGDFDAGHKSPKQNIREWLSKNAGHLPATTRENIAKLVNPTDAKKGGAPPTPVKYTQFQRLPAESNN